MYFYVHIPFCKSKCKYCHFASFTGVNNGIRAKYLDYLKKEINDFFVKNPTEQIESVYFGGGTPSILSIEEIRDVLDILRINNWQNTEITFESNPESITDIYVKGLKDLGINRLSLGIQTLNNKSLTEIGRCSREKIFKALEIIKKNDFPNVGVDFIIGLPYALKGEVKNDIEELLNRFSNIKHISVYMLEEGKYQSNWKDISIVDEDFLDEYREVSDFLDSKGFLRYEMSNFAKTGFECKHNKSYWNHSNYRGFGLSASSFVDGKRFANADNFLDYFVGKIAYEEQLSEEELQLEKIMFDIRTKGMKKENIKNLDKLDEFIKGGFLVDFESFIKPTYKGIMILDYIMKNLI